MKLLLVLSMVFSDFSFSFGQNEHFSQQIGVLEHFAEAGDTTAITGSLTFLYKNLDVNRDQNLLPLLLKASEKEDKLHYKSKKGLYYLIRRFYESEENKSRNFEYSLKLYKTIKDSGDNEGLMWILIDIGNIFYSEEDYEEAVAFFQKAEAAGQKAKHYYGLSVIYLNYGLIAERQKKYEESLKNYKVSSMYRHRSGNIKVVSSTYIKIANAYLNLDKPDSALIFIHLAEDYYYHKGFKTKVLIDMPFNINFVYSFYYSKLKDYPKSIHHIREAEKIAQKHDLTGEWIIAKSFESKFHLDEGHYQTAIDCVAGLLPLCRKYGLYEYERFLLGMLSRSYAGLGDYRKSTETAKRYIAVDDRFQLEKKKSQLNMIHAIAAVYESEAKLMQTEKELQIAKFKTKMRVKQRNTFGWIAFSSILGALVLMGLFLNSRKNKSRLLLLNNQLIRQNMEFKINSIELKRSNKLKDKLFSIVGHDLRNPLNRLMVELALVKKEIPDKHLTDPMENTLKETINLFEDLLHWSKEDRNKSIYHLMKVSLDENINKIILFYLPEIRAREIKIINKSIALSTYADQNILQTLLRNLLSNSIASVSTTTGERKIQIETILAPDGEQVEIIFSDSGAGFPKEILEKFREDQFGIDAKNSGLGLSICKVLVRMSGWKMEIGNEGVLNGAKISIFVPHYSENVPARTAGMAQKLSAESVEKLIQLKNLKFYQTSQIRSFIRNLGEIEDPVTREWILLLEKSVHDGDQQAFESLLDCLNESEIG